MRKLAPGLLATLLASVACAPTRDPVASVSVSPTSLTLRYSEVRLVDFEFEILQPWREGPLPRVFVHLYDEPGNVLRTFDHPFPGDWVPGRRVRRELKLHQSALGPPLRAGRYSLSVGLYDAEGRRWPLAAAGREIDEMEYEVAEIAVSEPGEVPMFRFSEAWKPIEAGLDRQVLGRRWLIETGSIWVTQASEVSSIWLMLQLPAAENGVTRLVLEDGADQPGVRLTSACGGTEIELSGSGTHELMVALQGDQANESGECELALEPNFHLIENGGVERRSVQLEGLAWTLEPE